MQKDFLYHAQVIIAISLQISHVGFEYILKQKSASVSNSSGLFQITFYMHFYMQNFYMHAYLN